MPQPADPFRVLTPFANSFNILSRWTFDQSIESLYEFARLQVYFHLQFLDIDNEEEKLAMAQNYKALKENFVSNLSGGTVSEINWVTAVAPVSPQ